MPLRELHPIPPQLVLLNEPSPASQECVPILIHLSWAWRNQRPEFIKQMNRRDTVSEEIFSLSKETERIFNTFLKSSTHR